MMIFNSFIDANDYNFGMQLTKFSHHIFLLKNKTLNFEGICLAVAGSFLQKELPILSLFETIL